MEEMRKQQIELIRMNEVVIYFFKTAFLNIYLIIMLRMQKDNLK